VSDEPPRFAARRLEPSVLDAGLLSDWQHLSSNALEANCFLAPWFVLPACRLLGGGDPVSVLVVEAFQGRARLGLAALACVATQPAARSLPRPHLAAYRPLHAYLSGALVDRRWAPQGLRALLDGLQVLFPEAGAVRLSNLRHDGPLCSLARAATLPGQMRWYPTRSAQRAALRLAPDRVDGVLAADAVRSRSLQEAPATPPQVRRALRRLARSGPVTLRILRGPDADAAAVSRHLQLEHAGWKGNSGGSLLADPRSAEFFREIVRGAAAVDQVFFCELLAGQEVVASTSNFVGSRQAFAFKVGWDPAHSRASPGLLVDRALADHGAALLPDVDLVDGCADPGSHLERIWHARIEVGDGYLAWGAVERMALSTFAIARRCRSRLATWFAKPPA
jgi:CelD/BcsL family acetyltransferase involved in cellulose biosynthesis